MKKFELKTGTAASRHPAVAAAARAAAQERTEELLIDYLEMETHEAEDRVIEQELEGSVRLRQILEEVALVRFEIAAADSAINPRLVDATEFSKLHEKIMKKIETIDLSESFDTKSN